MKNRKRFSVLRVLLSSFSLTLFIGGVVRPGNVNADGFVSQYGWSCEGSSEQYKYIRTDVQFMTFVGGNAHFRVRTLVSADVDAKDLKKLTTVEHVLEQQSEQAYVYALPSSGGTNPWVELTIRKVEGSDQGLRATLTGTELSVPAKLTCSRTRI